MNTQTHMLMGAVLYGRLNPKLLWAGLAGGLLPDLPMYIIFAALKMQGVTNEAIFGTYFFSDWWQIANAIGHNFWLWSGLLFAAIVGRRRAPERAWQGISFTVAAAALTHSAVDFLCHREDAHMHF